MGSRGKAPKGDQGGFAPKTDEILAIETVSLHRSFIKCGQFMEIGTKIYPFVELYYRYSFKNY